MKKIQTLLLSGLIACSALAQAPQKMSYQAVIRNTANELVTAQPVTVRLSVLQGGPNGNPVFVERHSSSTNANGLVSLEIGNGTVVSGNFSTIDWSNGPYFILTETDPTGGSNYTISGTSQFMSVPYALYAERSNTPGPTGPQGASAYDIAVQNGFQGTHSQWLSSLRGADGQDGADGQAGSNGASAYDIAVQNGFQGTQSQWVNSLRGADGQDGADGQAGSDGASAYDIAVQNGFQGTQSQWVSSLRGADGQDGANGADGKNSLVRTSAESPGGNCSTGGMKLEYGVDQNNNGSLDNGEVNHSLTRYICDGAAGVQGPQGPQGPAGSYTAGDGISISNGSINAVPVEFAYYSIGNAVQSSVQTLSPIWFAQANGITSNGTSFTLNANKLYEVTAVFQIYNVGLEQYTYMFYNVTSATWVSWCPAYFGESGNDRAYRNETIKFMWKSSSQTEFEFRKFSNNTVNGNLIGTVMIKEIR